MILFLCDEIAFRVDLETQCGGEWGGGGDLKPEIGEGWVHIRNRLCYFHKTGLKTSEQVSRWGKTRKRRWQRRMWWIRLGLNFWQSHSDALNNVLLGLMLYRLPLTPFKWLILVWELSCDWAVFVLWQLASVLYILFGNLNNFGIIALLAN